MNTSKWSATRALAVACYVLLVVFVGLIVQASFEKSLLVAVQELLRDGWGRVSLFDLYAGFFIFAVLVCVLEGSFRRAWLWVVAIVFLGNLVPLFYVARRAQRAETLREVFTPGPPRPVATESKLHRDGG